MQEAMTSRSCRHEQINEKYQSPDTPIMEDIELDTVKQIVDLELQK
jgi:hypothetical protein